jgi:hypothetical protein
MRSAAMRRVGPLPSPSFIQSDDDPCSLRNRVEWHGADIDRDLFGAIRHELYLV